MMNHYEAQIVIVVVVVVVVGGEGELQYSIQLIHILR